MTTHTEHSLKTGGDPRTLADYAALRDEMNKLAHPARPDVNWQHAEKRCLSLFEHNGVELQTTAWYTLTRTRLAGLYGMNEGLAILVALVSREWDTLWPHPVPARMEILSALSRRLQQVMRTLSLTYADLSQLYQAEAHLKALGEVLQRLELKHASQLDALRTWMHNAAARLENSDQPTGQEHIPATDIDIAALASAVEPAVRVKWVYVAQPEPQPKVEVVTAPSPPPAKPWKPFLAGALVMLLGGGAALWSRQALHQPEPGQAQLAASLAPLPAALSTAQLQSLKQTSPSAETGIRETQRQLARLAGLPPDWTLRYGGQLAQQAQALWPAQGGALAQVWRQRLNAAALPEEKLNGWHQGMTQLQQLADRLNGLDEQRGKYMTVSELKSVVFTMIQSFNSAVPVEEQLRQLSQVPETEPLPMGLQNQADLRLKQLLARYAFLQQHRQE